MEQETYTKKNLEERFRKQTKREENIAIKWKGYKETILETAKETCGVVKSSNAYTKKYRNTTKGQRKGN